VQHNEETWSKFTGNADSQHGSAQEACSTCIAAQGTVASLGRTFDDCNL